MLIKSETILRNEVTLKPTIFLQGGGGKES